MMRAMKRRANTKMVGPMRQIGVATEDMVEAVSTPWVAEEMPPEIVLSDWVVVHHHILPRGWQDMNVTVEEATALLKDIAHSARDRVNLPSRRMLDVATYFNQAGT